MLRSNDLFSTFPRCVRSVTAKEVGVLMEKVEKCFRAAALATGCTYKLTLDGPPYNELRNNLPLAVRFPFVSILFFISIFIFSTSTPLKRRRFPPFLPIYTTRPSN